MRRPSKHIQRTKAAAIVLLIMAPAIFLPALSRAQTDYSAPKPLLKSGPIGAPSSPKGRDNQMLQDEGSSLSRLFPAPNKTSPLPGIDQPVSPPIERQFTPEEARKIRQVIEPGHATAIQVALVNIAVKGTSLIMYFCVWCIGLWILRREFDYWFDQDVYSQTWPSVAVIVILLICTAWVLVSTVQ